MLALQSPSVLQKQPEARAMTVITSNVWTSTLTVWVSVFILFL